jgi:hypothetical protein
LNSATCGSASASAAPGPSRHSDIQEMHTGLPAAFASGENIATLRGVIASLMLGAITTSAL